MKNNRLILLFLITMVINFFIVLFFPPIFDEAYYSSWTKTLAFGYLDHPPMVAWTSFLGDLLSPRLLGFKVSAWVANLFYFVLSFLLIRLCNIKSYRITLAYLLLSQFCFAAFALKAIYTPDTPLIIFWLVTLLGCIAVYRYSMWFVYLISFGLAGALLSKYTAVLITPCIFYTAYLVRHRPRFLSFFLSSILLCLAFLSPHVVWLYKNDFVSVKAQVSHGFSGNVESTAPENRFPSITRLDHKMTHSTAILNSAPDAYYTPRSTDSFIVRAFQQFLEYAGGLALLMGLYAFLLIYCYLKPPIFKNPIPIPVFNILKISTVAPMILFGISSFFAKVEANWLAIALIGAMPIFALYVQYQLKILRVLTVTHLFLVFIIISHLQKPFIPLKHDRLLFETTGYDHLVNMIPKTQPCYSTSYQLSSMIHLNSVGFECLPYQGASRVSQYDFNQDSFSQPKAFTLVSNNPMSRAPEGYHANFVKVLFVCKNKTAIHQDLLGFDRFNEPCPSTHRFVIYKFMKDEQ